MSIYWICVIEQSLLLEDTMAEFVLLSRIALWQYIILTLYTQPYNCAVHMKHDVQSYNLSICGAMYATLLVT